MEENDKNTTYAARMFNRTLAMCEFPDNFPPQKPISSVREDLEQLRYKIKIRLESMKHKENLLCATSSYINDCLGIEIPTLEAKMKKEKSALVITFADELANHKIISACCGDFHTLVLSKSSILTKETETYKDFTDVYGFGQNVYGQVTGSNTKKQVARPVIISHCIGRNVKHIDAKGSRSVAVTASGEIYEWGFPDIKVRQTGFLEGIEKMKIGLTFNIYLTKNSECYIHGKLTDMDGDNLVEYAKPTFIGLVWQVEEKTFVDIATGYNHAVLLSKTNRVYVWGIGKYGQLGLTSEVRLLLDPYPIDTLCSEHEKILKIFATANHSFALSNLGVLYSWGALCKPANEKEEGEILWSPEICRLDDSLQVLEVSGLQHEILVMDKSGKIAMSKLNQIDREFRIITREPLFTEDYRSIAGCGIGHQIYLKPYLVPEKCVLELESNKWTIGEWCSAKIKLFSNCDIPYPVVNIEKLRLSVMLLGSYKERLPSHNYHTYTVNSVKIIQNTSTNIPATEIIQKQEKTEEEELKEFEDRMNMGSMYGKFQELQKLNEHEEKPANANIEIQAKQQIVRNVKKLQNVNDSSFDYQIRVSELDDSEIKLDFSPTKDAVLGKFYLHLLISEEYIGTLQPLEIEICKGKETASPLDALKIKAINDRKREAAERKAKLEAELKAKREREEAEEKRRKMTEERAADALKELKKRIKETEKKLAEERKARLDLITGGGFDISKLPKK